MGQLCTNESFFGKMTDLLYFKCVATYGAFPAEAVVRILPKTTACRLPFSRNLLQGLVSIDNSLAALVIWPPNADHEVGCNGYFLLIKTPKGNIIFPVDAVSTTELSRPAGTTLYGLDDIEALVADFAEAKGGHQAMTGPPVPEPPDPRITILIAEATGALIAVPATPVIRIDRHQGSTTMRVGDACERLVTIDGTLMAGFSLDHWLDPKRQTAHADSSAEPWALILDDGGRHFAVTVKRLRGLVEAERHTIQTIAHRLGTSYWYLDPARGPIEIIDPTAFAQPSQSDQVLAGRLPPPSPSPTESHEAATERRAGLQVKRGLGVQVGPYFCVFPAASTLSVIGDFRRNQISTRQAGSYPVLDLAALLDIRPQTTPGRAILVKRRHRRAIIILVDEVITVSSENVRHPLPALPTIFHDLLNGIGYDGTRIYLHVKEEVLSRRPIKALAGLSTRSLIGYAPRASLPDWAIAKL